MGLPSYIASGIKILLTRFLVPLFVLSFCYSANAAYTFQVVSGEALETLPNNVVWSNNTSQTGFPSDDDYQVVNIGFTFYLGETAYTQVRIVSNGSLHFGTDQGFHKHYTNTALPITTFFNGPGFEEAADRVIAGYWDDLGPQLGGTVTYGTLGSAPNRRFVASWRNVPHTSTGGSYNFQIVIYENGDIRYRYGTGNGNGSSATIGIEVNDSDFTQFSFNSNSVGDANDILWKRAFPGLVSASASCTDTNKVTLTFSGAVSPVRASNPSNFSINNGVTVLASTLVNPTTVELTTSTLTTGITYTVSTTFPNQSTTFSLATANEVLVNSASPGIGSYTVAFTREFTIAIQGGEGGGGSTTRGGQGATVTGVFNLTAGDIIRYVVGAGSLADNSAGGAGSTGVFINNTLVMVAGGGGGGDNSSGAIGLGANNITSGDAGTGSGPGAGGTGGAGGGGVSAGGGGGINAAGGNSSGGQGGQAADMIPGNGVTFVAGGAPGANTSAGGGGFTGGGGGSNGFYSGGGGGYSGGGSAGANGGAGGGGSFLNTAATGYVSGSIVAGADGAPTGGAGVNGADGTINITARVNCGPAYFEIVHDGSGINCLREAISIRASDSLGGTLNNYTGTINLSLTTNRGNWFVTNESGSSADLALGTLVDTAGDNNGAATYQFVAGDLGRVTLYLENTQAETTNINVTEGTTTDNNTEGNITFRPFGFVATPTPITTQIAGRAFNATLTAAGQTPTQPNCGVIEEYTGSKAINFWSNYSLPNTSLTPVLVNGVAIANSEATSFSQSVNFTAGVANLSLRYDDVGLIGFRAKDQAGIGEPPPGTVDEIIGGVTPFVVRPFAYDVQIAGNPVAVDASALVYAVADANFNMTLRSILWQSADDNSPADGTPDTGSNLADNGITPNISLIAGTIGLTPSAQLVTNSNGILNVNSVAFSSFPAPASASAGNVTFTQRWNEVGILQIAASTANFMGSGQGVTGSRNNIGRFVPDHFVLTLTDNYSAQCSGSFNYGGFSNGVPGLNKNGQSDDIGFTVQARNLSNNPTANYDGVFAKLEAGTIARSPYNVSLAAPASGTLSSSLSAINFNISGNAPITLSNLNYLFDNLLAPFDLQVDINATDADLVTGSISTTAVQQRLGRMRLTDAYGPELSDLEIQIAAEYYDGSAWRRNTADSCSNYIHTSSTLVATSYTDNLNAGETASYSPLALQTLTNGSSALANGIWFSAPGNGNFGSVQVNYSLATQPWLSSDWNADNINDPSSARLYFGYYRGSDRVIYWREVRN
jgi:hypothetical protein